METSKSQFITEFRLYHPLEMFLNLIFIEQFFRTSICISEQKTFKLEIVPKKQTLGKMLGAFLEGEKNITYSYSGFSRRILLFESFILD